MSTLSPTAVYVKSMTKTNHANKSQAQKKKNKRKKLNRSRRAKYSKTFTAHRQTL